MGDFETLVGRTPSSVINNSDSSSSSSRYSYSYGYSWGRNATARFQSVELTPTAPARPKRKSWKKPLPRRCSSAGLESSIDNDMADDYFYLSEDIDDDSEMDSQATPQRVLVGDSQDSTSMMTPLYLSTPAQSQEETILPGPVTDEEERTGCSPQVQKSYFSSEEGSLHPQRDRHRGGQHEEHPTRRLATAEKAPTVDSTSVPGVARESDDDDDANATSAMVALGHIQSSSFLTSLPLSQRQSLVYNAGVARDFETQVGSFIHHSSFAKVKRQNSFLALGEDDPFLLRSKPPSRVGSSQPIPLSGEISQQQQCSQPQTQESQEQCRRNGSADPCAPRRRSTDPIPILEATSSLMLSALASMDTDKPRQFNQHSLNGGRMAMQQPLAPPDAMRPGPHMHHPAPWHDDAQRKESTCCHGNGTAANSTVVVKKERAQGMSLLGRQETASADDDWLTPSMRHTATTTNTPMAVATQSFVSQDILDAMQPQVPALTELGDDEFLAALAMEFSDGMNETSCMHAEQATGSDQATNPHRAAGPATNSNNNSSSSRRTTRGSYRHSKMQKTMSPARHQARDSQRSGAWKRPKGASCDPGDVVILSPPRPPLSSLPSFHQSAAPFYSQHPTSSFSTRLSSMSSLLWPAATRPNSKHPTQPMSPAERKGASKRKSSMGATNPSSMLFDALLADRTPEDVQAHNYFRASSPPHQIFQRSFPDGLATPEHRRPNLIAKHPLRATAARRHLNFFEAFSRGPKTVGATVSSPLSDGNSDGDGDCDNAHGTLSRRHQQQRLARRKYPGIVRLDCPELNAANPFVAKHLRQTARWKRCKQQSSSAVDIPKLRMKSEPLATATAVGMSSSSSSSSGSSDTGIVAHNTTHDTCDTCPVSPLPGCKRSEDKPSHVASSERATMAEVGSVDFLPVAHLTVHFNVEPEKMTEFLEGRPTLLQVEFG